MTAENFKAPDLKRWYILKVRSSREESIRNALERRAKIEGLQECFGEIVIPTEKYTDVFRNGGLVEERKLYPGYLMVNVEYNNRVRDIFQQTLSERAEPKVEIGHRIKVNDGPFAGMEGEVKQLPKSKNLVRVEIIIFGRPVSVELEYWQVDTV